ncbi:MAG TPA: flagellar biosynthetic protein FliO [Candidatus Rifleibacterium sp.]|nr:flagellar biosynthetic protein FliO [Candidatus Rifleibacterium sp.]
MFSDPATISVVASPTSLFLDLKPASMPLFPDSDPMGTSLRILSSLFAVILLAFGISWFIQKKAGIGGNVFGKILGILPLDNKRMIYLVDVMGKVLILGVTESNINLLGELTDKDTLDALRLQNDQPSPGIEKLFAYLSRKNEEPAQSQTETAKKADEPEGNGNLQRFRSEDRLKKLNAMLHKRNDKDNSYE